MFLWARKLKKVEIEENYVTIFNTLKYGLKNYLEDWVSEIQFKIEYFWRLADLKRGLGQFLSRKSSKNFKKNGKGEAG